MKKILLSLVALVCCMTVANAQLIQRNPAANVLTPRAAKTPVMKALGENQLYMGPYTSDALAEYGLGLSGYSGIFKMGVVLPMDLVQPFNGGQVKAIRFGLCASVTNAAVFIYPITSLDPFTLGDPLVEQEVASTVTGWNEIALTTTPTIDTEGIVGLLLGYQYKQIKGSTNACYPISVVEEGAILTSLSNLGTLNENHWDDIGLSEYGNLSIQAIVENENFPHYNLTMSNLVAASFAKASDGVNFRVNLANLGLSTLESYTIDMLVDGEVKGTIDSPQALTPTAIVYSGTCPTEGLEAGTHELSLRVKTVAGEEIADGKVVSTNFASYIESFPRQKYLAEQFTSTTCMYCPLGANVLNKMKEQLGEKLVWVGIHVNIPSTGDPYVIAKGTSLANYLGVGSAPSGAFDRYDAYLSGTIPQSLGYYEQYAAQAAQMIIEDFYTNNLTPALASIDLAGSTYDADTRELKIKVKGDVVMDFGFIYGENVGLTVYLTEDSLVARQNNQGTYVDDYVHNGVARAIPTAYNGDALGWDMGRTCYENEYTVTLNSAFVPENMHIVALVHRKGDGTAKEVINCEILDIKDLINAGVPGDSNGDGLVDITDVNAVINMMLGKAEADLNCDMNGDGLIDITDVNLVINAMLGK